MSDNSSQIAESAVEHHHSIGYGTLIMVWLGLVALTSVTVAVAGINFGGAALLIALMIASAKTVLVMNYFMHIKFESRVFKVFILVCFVTLFIIILLTFSDLLTR
jgi:cytochrome c oxidase subunit 4